MILDQFLAISFSLLLGFFLGLGLLWGYYAYRFKGWKMLGQEIITKAEKEAETIRKQHELQARQQQAQQQKELEALWHHERKKTQQEEERLKQKEDRLESRMSLVEKKMVDLEKREALLMAKRSELEESKKETEIHKANLLAQLEKASGLSSTEARSELLAKIANDVKNETANLTRRLKKEAEEEADRLASSIIATAINRLSVCCVSEATVTTVSIPNEEMKGRIIGREGRNIRALERLTGVNFIIDDTPGAVVLSGFDPIRKQVAKLALNELLLDGRIHPTRIEEAVDKANLLIQKQIKAHGEDAALRAGAMNLHPELINLLGKLKFRYSFGQNVLDHSLEVSHLLGIMAAELNLDAALAKRIGLLHDIGKALSHDVEGSHAIIGHDLAIKYGESKLVANGIGSHHDEMAPLTIEGMLCSSADRISASRPGARIEAVEEYIKRLRKMEDLAHEFPGIERAYALQAGREIRIAVIPEMIDDDGIVHLARDLTKRIESELTYAGKIKVTVIREKRVVEYAV